MECVKHPGNKTISVCVTCDTMLVCVGCMTDDLHNGHVFRKPNTVSCDIKAKLKSKVTDIYKLEIDLESETKDIEAVKKQQNKQQKERVKLINTRREDLIKAVNEMADTFISDYENQTQKNCIELQGAVDDYSTKLEEVRRHREQVKRVLDEQDDVAVVHDSGQLKHIDGQRQQYPELADIEFTQGDLNIEQLKLVFTGKTVELQKLATPKGKELILQSTIKHSESNWVSGMCNASYGKSWVKCYSEPELKLIDKHGHVEKTVKLDSNVRGMTVVSDEKLLLCAVADKKIKEVRLPSGKVVPLFSTGNMYPEYICATPSGDLYVTLVDKHDFITTANSQRILVRYSPKGQEIGRARFDRRGDCLFVWPLTVKISNTGDVIGVINDNGKQNNHLVLLNTDLTLRLRYLGNGKVVSEKDKFDTTTYRPEQKYAINDFIFDLSDNIIVAEVYTKCILLLSKDCVPICTLLPQQEYPPMAMTMDGDRMWVGYHDGTVKVYQLK